MRAVVAAVVVAAAVGTAYVVLPLDGGESSAPGPSSPPPPSAVPPADTPPSQEPAFDRSRRSTTDPRSIWVVVNKRNPIAPLDYRPDIELVRGYQVARPAAPPLGELLAASDRRGLGFKIASAFRSYDYQQGVYAGTVVERGQAAADRVSARPGYSEHQTGLAVDLVTPASPACDFDACFAGTPGGRWLARNAWRYGFVLRYPAGSAAVTGYDPEPWHLRYVGCALAAELRRSEVATLEELFGIPGGDYREPPAR
ncbi:hypothetical protein GCM10027062_44220 [Nocardioides hungaricus]